MENRKIIQVEEKVPAKLLIPLSIQHMFAMFGASVLVPFVFGINPAIVYEWCRNIVVYFSHERKGAGISWFEFCIFGAGRDCYF